MLRDSVTNLKTPNAPGRFLHVGRQVNQSAHAARSWRRVWQGREGAAGNETVQLVPVPER